MTSTETKETKSTNNTCECDCCKKRTLYPLYMSTLPSLLSQALATQINTCKCDCCQYKSQVTASKPTVPVTASKPTVPVKKHFIDTFGCACCKASNKSYDLKPWTPKETTVVIYDGHCGSDRTIKYTDVCPMNDGDYFYDAGILFKFLKNNPSVIHLDLNSRGTCDFSGNNKHCWCDNTLCQKCGHTNLLCHLCSTESKLTCIVLAGNNIEMDEASTLSCGLAKNSTLLCLDLSDNNLGNEANTDSEYNYEHVEEDKGIIALAKSLKSNSTLIYLSLNSTNIHVKGAKAIAEALKQNSTLSILHMHRNMIGDEGAKSIAESLKTNKTLTCLDLRATWIGDEGAKAIFESLQSNPSPISVNLTGNLDISDDVKQLLKKDPRIKMN